MTTAKPTVDPIDPKLVRKLADILKETELTEIEVEQGDLKIRVARQLTAAANVTYAPASYAAPAPAPVAAPAAAAPVEAAPAPAAVAADAIKSPMVGTVYLAAQPGSPPFIKVGDRVKQGQTLLIVEAMKTMNPIPSPREGVVAQILVTDSQPVEFGEPLVVFE
ncbi:acetyl-CoA carboxylase biotin carboxyl carrier protein [Asticcacaulis sp. 201]|uniref:acetyl-CoA carboxylase biotin carboxyl carrier protein n=1 Tax=Asticcacaulis sp. 201 TaxID=3028787 RepID=UPI0029167926|nr:acetyl-CoA carboxylase biotin carboxyl carrier protein [Asticcacaulis sp. 201]MDV6329470.1 acetyl-CoA carboxylase biotin carboxyl carrier protein [Asticcacaulis sp. 201]